jgi:hypothetical protein
MSFFGKLFKKDSDASAAVIPAEIYRNVHVMRDDIDEIQGKPKESFPEAVPGIDPAHANSPFLGGSATHAPQGDSGSASPPSDFGGNRKKVLALAISIFVVLAVSALVWHFFFREGDDVSEISIQTPVLPLSGTDAVPTQVELPIDTRGVFSLGMPNYLQIDPESDTSTPGGIVTKLTDTARKAKEMNASEPIEFLVRDANNNPIAFSRFAYLAELGIPEDILSVIDEPFSLYLVPDGGEIRLALSLKAKDAEKLSTGVASLEESLPVWFGRLLYESSTQIPKQSAFHSGTYGTIGTRFASVDASKNYSFDYAFIGGKWVIGTSKDSFRAALGEIAMNQEK